MAGYKGHLTGATIFFAAYLGGLLLVAPLHAVYAELTYAEQLAYPLVMLALCLMFGLWPDVDTNSKGQNLFYTIFFVADVVLIASEQYEEAAFLGLFAILPGLGKHRGWTHTWWAMLLIPAPLLVLPWLLGSDTPFSGWPLYGAALTGYFSHLVLDGLVIRFKRRKRKKRGLFSLGGG